MVLQCCKSPPCQSYWGKYSVKGIKSNFNALKRDAFRDFSYKLPPYLWGEDPQNRGEKLVKQKLEQHPFSTHFGYSEARTLIGNGNTEDLKALSVQAQELVTKIFEETEDASKVSSLDYAKSPFSLELGPSIVRLRLSSSLESWKDTQYAAKYILPPKGAGLVRASDTVLRILGAEDWPEALKTNNALFGCGMASLLIGAADAPTVFSNYLVDMAFYYEHGYNYVFPSLEPLLQKGLKDPRARCTVGGSERRDAVAIGKLYIQGKIDLEKKHVIHLTNQSARLNRRSAQIISLSESSLLGMAAEAAARGMDPAAVMSDLVFSSPGTDVLDVGSDLCNSEVMNSFLNVTDITDTGIVSEDVLRRVYDAYAATPARMLTQRWHEPTARMCAALYTWHIQNDRHMFLRRAILGWSKARKTPGRPQYEADFDEVFDEQYRTTGFRRPLEAQYACDGEDTCNRVQHLLDRYQNEPLLGKLWGSIVTGPLEYVRGGKVDEERENGLTESSRLCMAELYSRGRVLEMVYLIAHANFHAWQVNYLFEAAMFGSILDGGKLAGKLDRLEKV